MWLTIKSTLAGTLESASRSFWTISINSPRLLPLAAEAESLEDSASLVPPPVAPPVAPAVAPVAPVTSIVEAVVVGSLTRTMSISICASTPGSFLSAATTAGLFARRSSAEERRTRASERVGSSMPPARFLTNCVMPFSPTQSASAVPAAISFAYRA